jgi:hypothetical protein
MFHEKKKKKKKKAKAADENTNFRQAGTVRSPRIGNEFMGHSAHNNHKTLKPHADID